MSSRKKPHRRTIVRQSPEVRGRLWRLMHAHKTKRFWLKFTLAVGSLGVLIVHECWKVDFGFLHHIAVCLVAERLAGMAMFEEG